MNKKDYDNSESAKKTLGFFLPILAGAISIALFKTSDYTVAIIIGISLLIMIISFLGGEKNIAIGVLSFYIFVGIIFLTIIGLCKFGSGGNW